MALIRWIIALPLVVGAILFALAHPQKAPVILNPFQDPIELPLYFVALSFLGAGFLLGALMAWISMGHVRKDRRAYKKEVKKLTKENKKLSENIFEARAQQKPSQATDIIEAN